MRRVVRDSCRACEKKVQFETEGEELRIDTTVGKVLNSVLVHLLRNSIDHGIESPEKRLAAGKEEEGTVTLICREVGEDIVVEIKDDGAGINTDVIRAKALEKGLYSEEQLDHMSDKRVSHIIFESGFSTTENVTEISGRGVGMDMVKSTVEDVNGKIYIESILGEGTTFTLVIPIPRSIQIINSLMVKLKEKTYTIPLDNVAEVVCHNPSSEPEKLQQIDGKYILSHHDELIPLVGLGQSLKTCTDDHSSQDTFNIVVIRDKNLKYGMIVDQIENIEEVVVKKLSPPLDQANEYIGTTFIGDGELSLILNVSGIAKAGSINVDEDFEEEDYSEYTKKQIEEDIEYMRFHLENSKNYVLPLDFVFRLEEFKVEAVEFSGEVPLIRYRESGLPLLFLEKYLGVDQFDPHEYLKRIDILNVIVIERGGNLYGLVVHELIDIGVSLERMDTGISDRDEISGTIYIDGKTMSVIDCSIVLDQFEGAQQDSNEISVEPEIRDEFLEAG
jgi:two-component system chemotaxis sensor kinase CheA